MQTITIAIMNAYGNEFIYPVCYKAILLARLAGKKTFSKNDIKTIELLGYSVIISATQSNN